MTFLDVFWAMIVAFALLAYLMVMFSIITDLFRDLRAPFPGSGGCPGPCPVHGKSPASAGKNLSGGCPDREISPASEHAGWDTNHPKSTPWPLSLFYSPRHAD